MKKKSHKKKIIKVIFLSLAYFNQTSINLKKKIIKVIFLSLAYFNQTSINLKKNALYLARVRQWLTTKTLNY